MLDVSRVRVCPILTILLVELIGVDYAYRCYTSCDAYAAILHPVRPP